MPDNRRTSRVQSPGSGRTASSGPSAAPESSARRSGAQDPVANPHIEACLADSPGAWEAFFEQYKGLIYSAIRRYQLPEDEAKDAFQRSMVAIYRQLLNLRDRGSLHTWIVSIASRQAIDQIRARARHASHETIDDAERQRDLPDAPGPLPDEELSELQDAQRAREALAAVSDRCRELLSALYFRDPPEDYRSIAQREGIRVSSVGALRGRCLGALRRYFESRGWIR